MTATAAKTEKQLMPWWLILIEGVALLILGFLFISSPAKTAIVATQVLGIYWLIAGIFKIISIFMDSTMWGLKLFAGILGIIAGLIVLDNTFLAPLVVGSVLVIVLGFQGIIFGAVGLVQAFRGAGWGAGVLGIISILFGILLLTNLWAFTFSLPWALGLLGIVGGVSAIFMAFKVK